MSTPVSTPVSTTATPVWRVVAEREVTTRLRDKTFLAATAASLLLVVGFFGVAILLGVAPPSTTSRSSPTPTSPCSPGPRT